ncbi:MAG: RIP metalloprotease RseP [Lachnospiraceae bacterium]|nr:RIP metalloprotease RseP [Lachnospiraceae bacterium]
MIPGIIVAIIVFSILVLFHEFGHFIMAKAVGIGVTEFSLGMGPRIFSFGKGETKYSLKALPFGGSCAMVGEDDPDEEAPNSFGAKPAWARFLVVFAGPAFNIILAFIASLFLLGFGGVNTNDVHSVTAGSSAQKAGIEAWKDKVTAIDGHKITMGRELMLYLLANPLDGSPVTVTLERDGVTRDVTVDTRMSGYRVGISYMAGEEAAKLSEVSADSPAEQAGLKAGDTVTSLNGTPIATGTAMQQFFAEHPLDGTPIVFTVLRDGQELTFTMTPAHYETYDLGFSAYYVYDKWDGNIFHLFREGFREVRYWLSYTFFSLKMLITGKVGVRDLSGPVGIVSTMGQAVEAGVESGGVGDAALNVLTMMVLLSVNLGIMNLLPIPALDGGRILFILFELIFRKPVPRKAESIVHFIGFILLMALMAVILFSDVLKFFGK